MTQTVVVGKAGLELIGNIEELVRHSQNIVDIFDNMDAEYEANFIFAVGQEGYDKALEVYTMAKFVTEQIKLK